jgi:hypothetical protein
MMLMMKYLINYFFIKIITHDFIYYWSTDRNVRVKAYIQLHLTRITNISQMNQDKSVYCTSIKI